MDNPDRRGPARLLLALAATLAVLLPGTPAWAHNALAEANPAKNATVRKAPTRVTLRFLQKLKPGDTTITVTGASPVRASGPTVDGATSSITFAPLGNGAYTVAYRVVSKDGHTVQGSYRFTVADPTRTAAPTPPASPAAAPPSPVAVVPAPVAQQKSSTFPVAAVVAGVVVLALVAAGGLFLARRRRTV